MLIDKTIQIMEPDRAHANKCALAVMCLRKYFPLDIVGLIASICWDLRSMPVYAILTDDMTTYPNWEIVKQNVLKICPQLRPRQMKFWSIRERTDRGFSQWYCVGLLIPGYVWNAMMTEYHCVDNDEIFCDRFEFKVIIEEKHLSITYIYVAICYDTSDPMLSSIPNVVQRLPPVYLMESMDNRASSLISSFMDIQNKVAF
jgi:hypothetical protein